MTSSRPGSVIRKAALYVGVSTDEQAERVYSLRDQQARLEAWCVREGVDIAGVWVEDGASAKTFERPVWSRLLAVAEAGRVPPFDGVIVVKWDRFSRDATGALGMIRRLDARGITVQAVEQPIDASVPEQLLMQVLYVAAPEVENRRRSLATKAGMRRAMLEGRWMHAPPAGYRRGRDERDRYRIVPDEAPPAGAGQASLIARAFRLAATTDRAMEDIRRELRAAGLRVGRMQFTNLLRNPVYAGRIVVPPWGGEPGVEVAGLHEPLVSAEEFAAVQQRRFGARDGRSVPRRRLVPEIPLRGHLLCPTTGARLSGSGSRSRAGHQLWYYHGTGAGAYRVRASTVHEAFGAWLDAVRLAPEVAALLRAVADERAAASATAARTRLDAARTRHEEAEAKLLAVDLRWLDGELAPDTYERLTRHLRGARDAAAAEVAEASAQTDGETSERVRFAADVLERLPEVWAAAPVAAQDALAGSMWPSGLTFDGAGFRTSPEDDLIGLLGDVRAENRDARASGEGGRPVWLLRLDLNQRHLD